MIGLLDFDEKTERKHMSSIYEFMLDRSFDGRSEFDHMFMSAGEGLGRSLEHLGAIDWKGSSIVLKIPEREGIAKIDELPVAELPLLTDVLDVLLTFLRQYAKVPKLTNPFRLADFDSPASVILKEMRLLNDEHVAQRSLWLFLVDHCLLLPAMGVWNENVCEELKRVCETTWTDAPEEFKAVIEGRSDRPVIWAEGYMRKHWRHGQWLTAQDEARSLAPGHSFLPKVVCHTLMNENKEVYVPSKFL